MPRFDAVASLRIWAVEADLAGQVLRIPPLPAADWLPILMRADVLGLMELIEDAEIEDALIDGTVKVADLTPVLESLLEAAAGRSTWSALMLAYTASENWHVVGADLARRGVRFGEISIGAALDAIYGSLASSMDEKALVRFNSTLDRGAPTTAAATTPQQRVPAPRPVPASAEKYVRERPRTRLRRPQDRQVAPTVSPTPPPGPPADSDPSASSVSPDAPRPPVA